MFRQASRVIARPTVLRAIPRAAAPARRFISTAPPAEKSRSWKSLAARVGAVGGIIYYYNTTDVFAEEPSHAVQLPETADENELLPTIESVTEERQKKREFELAARAKAIEEAAVAEAGATGAAGIEGLEQEADQQGAFNPETGEINWDCPCLGGMAHGPCGEEFKTAFSCFIFSEEDPKGMDCIDKFKDMQNCFRQYPEVYGSELTDQDDEDDVTAEELNLDASAERKPAASPEILEAASGPHSAEKVAENKRELGVVPPSYRPEGEEQNDRPVVDVLKKTGQTPSKSA